MRIIAGEFRSRKLRSVPGMKVRPTPDRLRESLFSVIARRLPGTVFLDAYAGSGAVGLEALSRGAKQAILIERNLEALEAIAHNVSSLGVGERVLVIRGSASIYIAKQNAALAFIDPPYDKEAEYQSSLTALAETQCALAIAQHSARFPLSEDYGALRRTRILKQGDNSLSFYERVEELSAGR